MPVNVIVGLQWGDEGKGRISHLTSDEATMVVRANGGANAGHTVVKNGQKYALHLLPSSIINPDCVSLIASGVVIDLRILMDEIVSLRAKDIKIEPQNLKISSRAHIVVPWHKELDEIYESMRENPIGTTKRGIGPAYADKCLRIGLRMGDLVGATEESLYKKLKSAYEPVKSLFAEKDINIRIGDYISDFIRYAKFFEDFICDAISVVHNEILKDDNYVVIEGAQATGLDIDYGTYPDVTSSSCISSGLAAAAGVGPTKVNSVYGIMKAYTSRVGEGPFPTELTNKIGATIRELGHEYGTSTGRPRRCGWLDLVWLKYAVELNGVTDLCINHMDTIGKLDMIMVCVKYEHNGKIISYVPDDLENCIPIYETFDGNWEKITSIGDGKSSEEAKRAKKYLNFIEEYLGVKALYLGWGPEQNNVEIRI